MLGAKYFIKTGMSKGYWQLQLSENSRGICTSSTHLGNVRPTRVPMGIRISGNIFDARVAAVLAHCEHTCQNHDDILIGTATLEELYLECSCTSLSTKTNQPGRTPLLYLYCILQFQIYPQI